VPSTGDCRPAYGKPFRFRAPGIREGEKAPATNGFNVRSEAAMNVQLISDFVLWCAILNYTVLLFWFVAFVFAHGWLLRLHSRWFHMSEDRFDSIHYASMAVYKIGILLFNLVPFLALRIAAR
jgi:hypothetical protein